MPNSRKAASTSTTSSKNWVSSSFHVPLMWQQLRLRTRAETSDQLEALLFEHGALSVSYLDAQDQPIFQLEPGGTPLWDDISLLALFTAEQKLEKLLALLRFQPAVLNREELAVESLADQAWERSWMENFKAMQFGERLWICPSWQQAPDPEATNIMLDPGLAFGSGTHATTSLCLRWLAEQPLQDLEIIDYGSGSGVLAIACARLGARHVTAVDNDSQAIAATLDNANRNNIGEHQISACPPEALPTLQADLLIANILAEPLHELAVRFAALLKPQGRLLLSGILEDQVAALQQHYQAWFTMDAAVAEDGWCRLTGTRND